MSTSNIPTLQATAIHIGLSCGPAQIASVLIIPIAAIYALASSIFYAIDRIRYGKSSYHCLDTESYGSPAYNPCGEEIIFHPDGTANHGNGDGVTGIYRCVHKENDFRGKKVIDAIVIISLTLLHCIPIVGGVLGSYPFKVWAKY